MAPERSAPPAETDAGPRGRQVPGDRDRRRHSTYPPCRPVLPPPGSPGDPWWQVRVHPVAVVHRALADFPGCRNRDDRSHALGEELGGSGRAPSGRRSGDHRPPPPTAPDAPRNPRTNRPAHRDPFPPPRLPRTAAPHGASRSTLPCPGAVTHKHGDRHAHAHRRAHAGHHGLPHNRDGITHRQRVTQEAPTATKLRGGGGLKLSASPAGRRVSG
jgi:hypothetical protein